MDSKSRDAIRQRDVALLDGLYKRCAQMAEEEGKLEHYKSRARLRMKRILEQRARLTGIWSVPE